MNRRKVLLDTDPGVGVPGADADDPIAILLALAHPDLDLVGVTTTFGNCPPSLTARGARAVLDAAGRHDIPVVPGRAVPLSGSLAPELVQAYAGARGRPGRIPLPEVAPSRTDAAEFIARTVDESPGEVTVVCIGPQTNLATALDADPTIAGRLGGVVFMGGALGLEPTYGHGNVTPFAECNVYFDPDAAQRVLTCGVRPTMVSLDVTNPATGLVLTEDDIRTVDAEVSPAAALFRAVCETYLEAPMFDWGHGCVLYDPLAVLAAAEPAVGSYRATAVAVDTGSGPTRGQTVATSGGTANVDAMVAIDGRAAVTRILALLDDFFRRTRLQTD